MINFPWGGPIKISSGKGQRRDGPGRAATSLQKRARGGWRKLGFESLENRLVLNTGPILTFHTTLGDFQLQLYSDVAPNTVANFLLYVNSGEYNNTIIHRTFDGGNAPAGNDIVQGGVFTTSSTPITNLTTQTLLSERSLTNARGTIAMALSAFQSGPNAGQTNPDSATSSFFFNTANNNTGVNFNLDTQGFTVFGAVIGNGMTVVDAMAAASTSSNGGQPFVGGQPIVINSVVEDGTISGNVFGDLNTNQVNDGNDVNLAGVTVFVDKNNDNTFDSGDPSAVTDANGNYTIVGVEPGTVTVRQVDPPGWSPWVASSLSVIVTAGQDTSGEDFPEFLSGPTVTLSPDTDSGASSSDGVTNFDNSTVAKALKFVVSGVADGATVVLMDGNTQIGQGTGSGGSATITTSGNSALAQGGHVITATQTLSNATGVAGPNLNLTIDSVAPQFTTPPPALPTSVQAGTDFNYDVNATEEGDTGFIYSLVGPVPNPGIVIDPSTGAITFHPDATQTGNYDFDVQATDLAGNLAIDPNTNSPDLKFTLAVVNQPPVIDPIPTQNVDQRGTLTVQVNATSPAGSADVLTYSLDSPPAGASIDAQSGLLTWNLPNSIPPGVTPITVRVTNASNLSSTQSFDVDVAAVNHPPVVSPITDKTIPVGNTLTVQVVGSDTDVPAQTLSYSLDAGAPAGASINSAGVFTFTPTQAQNGQTFQITARVTDNGDPAMSTPVTFNVTVNGTPIFTPVAAKTVNIGSLLTFPTTLTHVNAVTYNLGPGSPAGATINQSGVFSWTPTTPPNAAGIFNVTLLATDHVTNLTGSTVVQVTVVQPNRAPVITAIPDQLVTTGHTLTVQVHATDADSGQTLTYSLASGAPSGASIDSDGLITFHAVETGPITQSITVKVTDNGSPVLSSSLTFKITTNPTAASNSTVRGYTGMGVDPLDSTGAGKALLVNGTEGPDVIQLLNDGQSVTVIMNYVTKGSYSLSGFSRIVVMGFGGDDTILVSKFNVGTIVDAGAGNDTIIGGISNDVLMGGTGDDTVFAYGGAKIIIGGGGADQLHGGAGRNLIIGGTTNFDANDLALGALLDEWASVDSDATAVARVQGTASGGQNGTTFLTNATVHDDNAVDQLFTDGNADLDWIFANLANTASGDQLIGQSRNRVTTQL